MSEQRPIGQECPYCGNGMAVTRMTCAHCAVSGGNLKEIAEQVGVSYPTIRSRLDKVIESLRAEIGKTRRVKGNVLDAVEPGTSKSTNAEDAARLIKGI